MNIQKALRMNRLAAFGGEAPELKLPQNEKEPVRWDEELKLDGSRYTKLIEELAKGKSQAGARPGNGETPKIIYSLESAYPADKMSAETPGTVEYPPLLGEGQSGMAAESPSSLLDRLEAAGRMRPQDMEGTA